MNMIRFDITPNCLDFFKGIKYRYVWSLGTQICGINRQYFYIFFTMTVSNLHYRMHKAVNELFRLPDIAAWLLHIFLDYIQTGKADHSFHRLGRCPYHLEYTPIDRKLHVYKMIGCLYRSSEYIFSDHLWLLYIGACQEREVSNKSLVQIGCPIWMPHEMGVWKSQTRPLQLSLRLK